MNTLVSVERIILRLTMDFDTAVGAFELQRQPGWEKASADLRESLNKAREIGDVSAMPTPSAWPWFVSAQAQVRCWLEAPPDVRRGVTPAVNLTLRTLGRFASNTIAEADVTQKTGGR